MKYSFLQVDMKHGLWVSVAFTFLSLPVLAQTPPPRPQQPDLSKEMIARTTDAHAYNAARQSIAAISLLSHINSARYYLAANDSRTASVYLEQARDSANTIMVSDPVKQKVAQVKVAKLNYGSGNYANQYFPLQTNPALTTKVDSAPFWTRKEMRVKDAEVVRMSIDLTKADSVAALEGALKEVENGRTDVASKTLGGLVERITTIKPGVRPEGKTRDNLTLAQKYLETGNYDAARMSLGHARDSLQDVKRNKDYAEVEPQAQAMLTQLDSIDMALADRDSTELARAKEDMQALLNSSMQLKKPLSEKERRARKEKGA